MIRVDFHVDQKNKVSNHNYENEIKLKKKEQGTVAHTYNHSYSRGRDRKDNGSNSALAKMFSRTHPSQTRSINKRIPVQAGPGIKKDSVWKITNIKSVGGMDQVQKHLPTSTRS
jgi:hypothetical protein